jgi:phosphoribosylformimino-5-aminoimidazole carboxamide ribotide isomerase
LDVLLYLEKVRVQNAMIIYPAIDLRHGRCVRLRQGDPNAETVFGDDPAQIARHWAEQGAEWLHVVNLDGALGATLSQISLLNRQPSAVVQRLASPDAELGQPGLPVNLQRLHEIRQAVDIPLQFGGGLRTLDDIQLALYLGADRVVLGTVAIEDPELVRQAIERWGSDRIVVGIDARDGMVAIHGWQETSSVDAVELGHCMQALGVKRVVYTDISRDGMLSGVNLEATARLGDVTGLLVIASGGVADISDIERLKDYEHFNIEGVITGQAIYTGKLDLASSIEIGHRPLVRQSCGIVPYRHGQNGPEFLLIWNSFFEQWQFPRGGRRAGEDHLTCASREFREETGLPIVRIHPDFQVVLNYTSRIRGYQIERTIHYFLAEVGNGPVVLGVEDHTEAHWLPVDEAREYLMETSPEQLPALDEAILLFP